MDDQTPAALDPISEPSANPAVSSLPPRLARRFTPIPSRNRNLILYGVIAVLVIAGVILPPISLFERLFPGCGDLVIDAGNASAELASGITIGRASAEQSYRLTLKSVPQAEFQAGAAEGTLAGAQGSLPVNLVPAGPVYQINVCGEKAQPGQIRVAVPATAASQSTLDLYGWHAKSGAWAWIGSSLNPSDATLSASVDALPDAVAVIQTTSVAPAIGVEMNTGESLQADVAGVATETYPAGLVIGADGSIGGDRSALPAANSAQATYPVIRNYLANSQPNPDLVRGVLSVAETRQAHLDALAALAREYAGVTLDYQGLTGDDRDAYTAFVADLAATLHTQGQRLYVMLPQPSILASGDTDTAGYDWYRLGLLADGVLAPMDSEPLIEWATALVNRYKFMPIFSVSSTSVTNGAVTPISFKQAIEPLGVVSATQTSGVPAGSSVTFTLQSDTTIGSFAFDAPARVYRYEFTDKSGVLHAVTINTAAALADALSVSLPHYVRGVLLRGAAGEAVPFVAEVLHSYRQQSIATIAPEIKIAWQVTSGGNVVSTVEKPLSESWFGWQAPAETGVYAVSASIAGLDRGETEVAVGEAASEEVRAVPAGVGGGAGGGATGDTTPAGASAPGCYGAAYVADVTVPDGTRFDKNKEFTKTWKVRNSGTCAWSADTELAFVSGSQLGAPGTLQVGPLEAGKDIEINVPMKTSDQDGNFTGVWQLRNKDGFYGDTLTVVIGAGEAPAAAAPAAVAPIGNIGGFEVGAHVDSNRRPDMLLYAGMKWIKIQTYAGFDMSGVIANAHAQGFKILLGVLGDKSQVMDPAYHQEYAGALAALAAGGADAIEVWNEPNIDREWPSGQVSGANYTALLAKAYAAIKAANPNTLVISGAPAPTGFFAGGCQAGGCNDDVFLQQMAAAGAANYMDCIGAHHNSGTTSPSVQSGRPEGNHYSWYFLPTLNLYYNSFRGARKVCFTELGYLSGEGYPSLESTAPAFAWARNTTVAQQAAWLAEAASLSARSGKVRLMIVWNADFSRYDSDPMAGYAIIRPGDACPACDSLRGVLGGR